MISNNLHDATHGHSHPYQKAIGWMLLWAALPLLWWSYQPANAALVDHGYFLFFHGIAELLAIVVSLLVFVTGYRALVSRRKGAVVLLGIGFLGVALLDFLHTLSYVGMPDAITGNSAQKSMFFWICARLLAASALLTYAVLPVMPDISVLHKRLGVSMILVLVGAVGFVGLSMPERLPVMFVPGFGLTSLKIGLEWLVIAINLVALFFFLRRRGELANECVLALAFTVALSAVSGLFFTIIGVVDGDAANSIGHCYKVVAYLYLFHATFNEALRRPMERMAVQNLREKRVLTAAPDGVLWVNQLGVILMVNPAMERLSGYSTPELVGQNVSIFLPEHVRKRHANSMQGFFIDPQSRAMGSMDLNLMRRDGQMLPVDISLGFWEDGRERHAIAYVRDLTERKGFEESLRHRATHDELTGLPNRWLFRLQLDQALAHAKRNERRVAALFLDLDNFKTINDSFGHATGDELLVQVARRLRGALREEDILARMGGDEFAILLPDLDDAQEAITVSEKLIAVLGAHYQLLNQNVLSGGSIGLAFYPDDTDNGDSLLRYADMAMYQAKQAGRGNYACFSEKLDQHAHANMQLHVRLKEAIDRGTLQLLYQPQIDVRTGDIVGAEALLRWNDLVLGSVPPDRFVPIAESTGLILPLSDWVLETACSQIAQWSRAGMPIGVAVNFSVQQFRHGDLPARVEAILQRTGASAHLLKIEVTESTAMEQPHLARSQLDALVAMGCTVALDDFGTGYSSLAYLKNLPVSVLKIDQSFIKDIPVGPNDMKITRSIVALAHSLRMTVVAEGVETQQQLDFLRSIGCEVYQGWLFSKALEATEFAKLRQLTSLSYTQGIYIEPAHHQ